jgi:hypothetical protein
MREALSYSSSVAPTLVKASSLIMHEALSYCNLIMHEALS